MAIHGSVSRSLVSGRLTLSAKCSRGNNQTYIYQEKVKGLGQKWVFLQMGAKSSTKHVSGGKELASPWVLTTYFGCGNAGMPIHTLTQEPGTCNEFIRKIADAFGSFGYSIDTVSHSRQEGLWEFVPEPV